MSSPRECHRPFKKRRGDEKIRLGDWNKFDGELQANEF